MNDWFTRDPLEVLLTIEGRDVLLLSLHTKSRLVHMGQRLWRDPATRSQYIAQAVRNRRRIAAELMRVRARCVMRASSTKLSTPQSTLQYRDACGNPAITDRRVPPSSSDLAATSA